MRACSASVPDDHFPFTPCSFVPHTPHTMSNGPPHLPPVAALAGMPWSSVPDAGRTGTCGTSSGPGSCWWPISIPEVICAGMAAGPATIAGGFTAHRSRVPACLHASVTQRSLDSTRRPPTVYSINRSIERDLPRPNLARVRAPGHVNLTRTNGKSDEQSTPRPAGTPPTDGTTPQSRPKPDLLYLRGSLAPLSGPVANTPTAPRPPLGRFLVPQRNP